MILPIPSLLRLRPTQQELILTALRFFQKFLILLGSFHFVDRGLEPGMGLGRRETRRWASR
eukprot:1336931-Amorphochlora_amoeboformis.AAC.1